MLFSPPINESVTLENADEWFTPKRFGLILALFVFAAFPDVVLGLRTFIARDFGYFGYPLAYFHRECFWNGEMPLWNPLSLCGMPFLAQWNTLTLYPLSLIYLLFPLTWSLPMFCLFHLWLAGFGMYFLAHRWTGNRFAAAFAGTAFAFNGLLLNCLMWPNNIAALGWMPWVILTMEASWNEGGRKIFVAALVAAMQFLTGGPEICLLTWLFGGALMTVFIIRNLPIWRRTIMRFSGLVLLFLALVAAQLLPFLEFVAHSHRDKDFANGAWSMPLSGVANFLVPLFHCTETPQHFYMQEGQGWTGSYYAGIVVVAVAFFSWQRRTLWRVPVLVGCLCLALLLALGKNTWLYPAERILLPFLRVMRYPVKFVVLLNFIIPLLGAIGLTVLQSKEASGQRRTERMLQIIIVSLIAVIVALAFIDPVPEEDWRITLKSGASRALLVIILFGVIRWLRSAGGRRTTFVSLVLIGVVWADAMTLEPSQVIRAANWVYQPGWVAEKAGMNPVPQHGQSRAMIGKRTNYQLLHNAIGEQEKNYSLARLALFTDCNLLDGLPKLDGFFSLYPRESFIATSVPYTTTNSDCASFLDFLGISQVNATGKVFDWVVRPNWMPMITAGQKPVYGDDNYAFGALYHKVDFRREVFLPEEARSHISVTNQSAARIVSSEFHNNRATVTIEASAATMVVIAQTYYPEWAAYVDGNSAKIWRANYAFQALQVPSGRHQLKIVYEDRLFRLGAMISVFALIVCLGGIAAIKPRGGSATMASLGEIS